ncbi:pneumococcal-type histidine triad protein [Streptococcus ruminantium]|uniref:Pneumococcal-type histidine triad protein n=1 Tax=Streptococcus ruminantium TaxID=1917441 RepID=A0ABU1B4E7_9STRE|nr:pneumococcal-type histidine triad protein [Streptococcus ruminantium]MDQ8759469.1 pneumococcal-type histidine triad protein [Streptococcus ruminantium]MDQ8768888.1 pneumococcal-type histidine triad protein [Streptococcus ruminantium]MDQ8774815.1 pneumococcal-type histidine triad protein [Streptococcus ruminantium]MDQ8793478.1 pneumococcal-type histidine triad protein [Streptococcus ruminantium]MDQ8795975.1 pneumococcal-type histidine triad protein [Streptococcus ruminantium]
MTKKTRLLALAGTGIVLAGGLYFAVHQSPKQSMGKTDKIEQKIKEPRSTSVKKETDTRKKVAGIDFPTDDGFLLENESQIQARTDTGIVVAHGGHSHFLFYSDLKGTKWSYLIPQEARMVSPTSPLDSSAAHQGTSSAQGHHYVFNPADIVAEDANGYTVRHGDHYHYILKSSLSTNLRASAQQQFQRLQNQAGPSTERTEAGIAGIHFPTSDGFLFDGTGIVGRTTYGLRVSHGEHTHLVTYDSLKGTTWENLIPSPSPQIDEKPLPSVPQTHDLSAEIAAKREHLAKSLGISVEAVKVDKTEDGSVVLNYPHGDHSHSIGLSEIDVNKPFTNPDEPIKQIEGETIEERKERLIKEYMERFKVPRENITVDGNYMSVKHGDHAHVYKIDPNLPDDPERDVKTETTNLDAEEQLVHGPFYTEGLMENLTRNGVYQKYKPSGIKNIKNFILLTFSTNSEYGDLVVNGKKNKRVYYLIRKDLNWEDLHIQRPDAVKHEGSTFKEWNAEPPSHGKMPREHQYFHVKFTKVKEKPTKNIYTPADDVSNIDLSNYVSVKYTTIFNGRLKLNDRIQGGFTYFVKSDLTWKQAKEQGLVAPEPVPNKGYEFIEFRNSMIGGKADNDLVSVTISVAAFGSTAPYLGPYIAANPENPTDINDPSRHPNYYWHDPKHYVAVAFKATEGGQLQTRLGTSKTVVYLVRKGLTLEQAGIFPPLLKPENGYRRDYNKPIIEDSAWRTPVLEDTTHHIDFEKKNSPQKDPNHIKVPKEATPSVSKDLDTPDKTDGKQDDSSRPSDQSNEPTIPNVENEPKASSPSVPDDEEDMDDSGPTERDIPDWLKEFV